MNINHHKHKLGLAIATLAVGSLLGATSAAEARVPCDAHGTEPCAEPSAPSGGGGTRPQVVELENYEYSGDVKDHPLYRNSGPVWTGDAKDHPLYGSNSSGRPSPAVDYDVPCASRPIGSVACAE